MFQDVVEQFVVIVAENRRRLVKISDVREIVPLLALTEVDGRSGGCRGVANLRGESIPLFDLSGPEAPLHPSRLILVTKVGASPVGLIVDEVHDVATVLGADVTTCPIGGGRTAVVARLGEEMVSVLDLAAAVESAS